MSIVSKVFLAKLEQWWNFGQFVFENLVERETERERERGGGRQRDRETERDNDTECHNDTTIKNTIKKDLNERFTWYVKVLKYKS